MSEANAILDYGPCPIRRRVHLGLLLTYWATPIVFFATVGFGFSRELAAITRPFSRHADFPFAALCAFGVWGMILTAVYCVAWRTTDRLRRRTGMFFVLVHWCMASFAASILVNNYIEQCHDIADTIRSDDMFHAARDARNESVLTGVFPWGIAHSDYVNLLAGVKLRASALNDQNLVLLISRVPNYHHDILVAYGPAGGSSFAIPQTGLPLVENNNNTARAKIGLRPVALLPLIAR